MTQRPNFWAVFVHYGRKVKAASSYPAPAYPLIIEPFAGSMATHLHHRPQHAIGVELDAPTVALWHRLCAMSAAELADFPMPVVGARSHDPWVIRASASSTAHLSKYRTVSAFMAQRFDEQRRYAIRHLDYARTVLYAQGDYRQAPDIEATWFVDPPYEGVKDGYSHGSATIDFAELAEWCMTRKGQVIVCEGPAGTWLPFREHRSFLGLTVNDQSHRNHEMVLTRTTHARCAQCSVTFPAARSDARYCSGRCRQRASRAGREAQLLARRQVSGRPRP